MGPALQQLTRIDIEELKKGLAEAIIAYFAYPRFLDYKTNSLRTRPVESRKRSEIVEYLHTADYDPFLRGANTTTEIRDFIEAVFTGYIDQNKAFVDVKGRRNTGEAKSLVRSVTTEVLNGFTAYLSGHSTTVYTSPAPAASWSESIESELPSAAISELVFLPDMSAERADPFGGEATSPVPVTPLQTEPQLDLAAAHEELPVERPAMPIPLFQTEPQPLVPAAQDKVSEEVQPEQPQIPVAIEVEQVIPAQIPHSVAGIAETNGLQVEREPEPVQMPPPVPVFPLVSAAEAAMLQHKPGEVSSHHHLPVEADVAPVAPPSLPDVDATATIFWQLQHQVRLAVQIAAVRHGLAVDGHDVADLLSRLEHQGIPDLSALQLTRRLYELSQQVLSNKVASLKEYQQALLLYLLFNRDGGILQ